MKAKKASRFLPQYSDICLLAILHIDRGQPANSADNLAVSVASDVFDDSLGSITDNVQIITVLANTKNRKIIDFRNQGGRSEYSRTNETIDMTERGSYHSLQISGSGK